MSGSTLTVTPCMAQAASRRPIITEARVRSQVSPCDICVGQSRAKAGLPMAVGFAQPLTKICPAIFLGVVKADGAWGVTTLQLSCADYLEICELQPPETLWALIRLYRECLLLNLQCKINIHFNF